jgi:hypothetical protein
MTQPKHAHESENGRYYLDPQTGEELISVTNALSVGMAKYGLPLWYAKNAAEYAMDNLPMIVARSRTDRDGALADIKAAAERVRDKASDLGTRVHDLAEAHVTGKSLARQDNDDQAEVFIGQYLQFLSDFEVDLASDVYSAETTVSSPQHGYAGTLDLLVYLPLTGFLPAERVKLERAPDGGKKLWLVDIKTSMTRSSTQCYPENALQLTALRKAKHMWLPDDTKGAMPPVAGTAVLNLRQKTYKLIPLPSGMAEWRAFESVLNLAKWLHSDWPGEYDYRPVTPAGKFEPKRNSKSPNASETKKVA